MDPRFWAGLAGFLAHELIEPMVLLGRTDHDLYTMTMKGKQLVRQCSRFHSPEPLLAYKRKGLGTTLALDQYTTAKLVSLLSSRGWVDKQQRKSTKIKPYTLDSERVWYHSDQQRMLSKLYLRVLVKSNELLQIENGVTAIFRFESQAYYTALLRGCNVRPGQPLVYYKMCMKKAGCSDDLEDDDADAQYSSEATASALPQTYVFDEEVSNWAILMYNLGIYCHGVVCIVFMRILYLYSKNIQYMFCNNSETI